MAHGITANRDEEPLETKLSFDVWLTSCIR